MSDFLSFFLFYPSSSSSFRYIIFYFECKNYAANYHAIKQTSFGVSSEDHYDVMISNIYSLIYIVQI